MGANIWAPGSTITIDSASLLALFQIRGGYCSVVAGTADAVVLTPTTVLAAYAAGQTFTWISSGVNTGPMTVAISGLVAKALTKEGAVALSPGDVPAGMMVEATYDGTRLILGEVSSVNKSLFTAAGDTVRATGVSIPARFPALASVAAHATTCNPWVAENVELTGAAVTFTDLADAPFAGAVVWLKMNTTHTWTNNATLSMPGFATYVAAADDWFRIEAITTSTFSIIVFKANGTSIAVSGSSAKTIFGLTYDNGTDAVNDININVGGAVDATGVTQMSLTSALGKQSDVVWAAGGTTAAPLGGLDTGVVGNSDYYIWLISRPDTGVVDVLFSLSSTAPTMPANYTYKRLIGWFKRVGGTIVAFHTYETEGGGLELNWDVPTLDVNLAATLTTARRTDAVKVPLNFSVVAHVNIYITDAAANFAWICCPDQTDAAPSIVAGPLGNQFSAATVTASTLQAMFIRTSSTGTIAARSQTATIDQYSVSTMGFRWARRN